MLLCALLKMLLTSFKKPLTIIILHVHPHVPLLLAVSKGAYPGVVTFPFLQNLGTYL